MLNYDSSFQGLSYQPEKAKRLLTEEGYSDKAKPTLELHINNNFVEMAELLAHQLSSAGFKVEIKLHPADLMMQLAAAGQLDFFRRSWMADYPDAENFLACFYSKNGSPPNYTRFSNAKYDMLYEKLMSEMNPSIRRNYYRQLEEILVEESPIVPLFYDQTIRLVQPNIEGLSLNVLNTLDLKRVKIK
jgi:peptide/nickel transport system substrate-binding protein